MTVPSYIEKNSRIEGRGLFAARPIAVGEAVIEYVGERIGKDESNRRQNLNERIFIFELDEHFDLDGDTPENPARFINHGCEPNCEAVAEGGRVWVRALRVINEGEEFTFDYGYRLAAFPGHRCRCGASSCVGFIVGREDRWRVRRLLNRPGRNFLPDCSAGRKEAGA